ncbi:ABC transporter ATP-binding protein [Clostridium lundense]|uniref:ABC transporter ATP-binding protein n=1 Tax=Clostridium lundense TaxID=319475 RepID=UPI000485B6D7|nr:ABC transporter ATP-binding protein [Clostridium lundense]
MEYILKTINLTKQYGDVRVVDNVNINIEKGDIYGFIGQNGAGKTTTLRMITNLIKPSSGFVELFGETLTPKSHNLYERIGSIIEFPTFYPNLTAAENLEIHRRMMGINDRKRIEESLDLVDLLDVRNKKAKDLSLGMKQRLGIAQALLHYPELLILDEPTNGLDPIGIKKIRELLINLSQSKKVTILISSHILNEIQHMATKIGIIAKGKLIEEVDYETIRERNRNHLRIVVDNDKKVCTLLEEKLDITDYIVADKNTIKIYDCLDKSDLINKVLVENNIRVKELTFSRENLEDYFIKMTGADINA